MSQASGTLERPHRVASPVPPLLFGTILFLASETLFFGGLFATYFTLRSQTDPWPPPGVELNVPLVGFATVLLVVSSFTLQAGVAGARAGRLASLRGWVAVSILFGLIFFGIQVLDWIHLWDGTGFQVSSSAYGTIYYAMTGFHALHVLAGVVLMVVILGRLAQGAYREGRIESSEAIAYYWHFVDVVWIGLFATIFLIK